MEPSKASVKGQWKLTEGRGHVRIDANGRRILVEIDTLGGAPNGIELTPREWRRITGLLEAVGIFGND